MTVAELVAGDQFRVVEVVASVHLHAFRKAPAHDDLLLLVQEGDLDAVDLRRVSADHGERRLERVLEAIAAPVARKLRIEHVAQPMKDHRLVAGRQNVTVDPNVVFR